MQNKIFFSKTREVKLPIRGTDLSAGIDFFVPVFNSSFMGDLEDKNPQGTTEKYQLIDNDNTESFIMLEPNERILIPAGIRMKLSDSNRVLIGFNKSGVASKLGLDVLACVIDADYQGEIHISMVNTGLNAVKIAENQKIIQFLELPIFYSDVEEKKDSEIYTESTERGSGGFGHTDKK